LSLAIVIPAFKLTFLRETLNSLVSQSNKYFNVYIGDDSSPEDLYSVVKDFTSILKIEYVKFENNLGFDDLAAHWRRCISLIKNEDWIWLLPDDDIIDPICVNEFYQQLQKEQSISNLYRFQTSHISADGNLLFNTPICPPNEKTAEFIVKKLEFKRSSSVAEYIFSRKSYDESGGFISLPLAWGSDDYLWICLSIQSGITTITNGRVYLRQSNLNISSSIDKKIIHQKFKAKYLYLKKILTNKDILGLIYRYINEIEFRKIIINHLFFEYKSHKLKFNISSLMYYAIKNNNLLGGGLFKNIYRLLRYKYSGYLPKSNAKYCSPYIIL
jgi:glycosyltransferase involved in cell wall biosynthesis